MMGLIALVNLHTGQYKITNQVQ